MRISKKNFFFNVDADLSASSCFVAVHKVTIFEQTIVKDKVL